MIAGALIPILADVLGPILRDAVAAPPESPDAEARTTQAAEAVVAEVQSNMALLMADANSADFFRAGWRHAFGWICVLATAYEYFLRPIASWLAAARGLPPLPPIPPETLWPMIGGLLGIAGLRTYEKDKGIAGNAGVVLGKVAAGIAKRAAK